MSYFDDNESYITGERTLKRIERALMSPTFPQLKQEREMQVQILNVTIETKPTTNGKSYQTADVAYKNLTYQGKVEGKKVMSFGATAAAFKVLAEAKSGEVYDVTVVKNDKGYNDWTSMTKGSANAPVHQPAADAAPASASYRSSNSPPAGRSTYETPEERAIKQVYIVKQSSISGAIATLSVGAKSVDPDKVLELAQKYTDFVFSKEPAAPNDSGFDDMNDDIPL